MILKDWSDFFEMLNTLQRCQLKMTRMPAKIGAILHATVLESTQSCDG